MATENLLAEFLREIRDVTLLHKKCEAESKAKKEAEFNQELNAHDNEKERLPDITMSHPQRAMFVPENGFERLEGTSHNNEGDHKDGGRE